MNNVIANISYKHINASAYVPVDGPTAPIAPPKAPAIDDPAHPESNAGPSGVAPSATPDGLDNPRGAAQYQKWKASSFGKSDAWKDAHIPAHLKVFLAHDRSVQLNAGIKDYSTMNYVATPEMRESTRNQIKAHYKEHHGLDIDPDKTYLMTFVYNVRGHTPPYPGRIISKISLTDAAIKNIQDTPGHDKLPKVSFNQHQQSPPPIEIVDHLTIGYHRSSGRHGYQNSPTALKTQQYEGIYFDPPAKERYDASNQAPITPKSFRAYVWDTSFSKTHKAELNNFWNEYRDKYSTLSKMSFVTAAHKQFKENTLSPEGRDLAMRLAGIRAQKPLDSLTAKDFQAAYTQDPNLELKELTFEGRVASGIFYAIDKTTQKTLLYMTGNSSPIHEFDNPTLMRKWLTEQMTDETKRKQFVEYFKLGDRADSVWEAGIDVHLEKTGQHAKHHTNWLEDRPFGGKPIEADPFKSMQARVEQYTYNNTDSTYVSNDDWKKKNVLAELKSASKSLVILAPVALAVPEIGIAVLLFDLGIAATEIGLGIDDYRKGRPGAVDRITFGAFNALQIASKEAGSRVLAPVVKPPIEGKILPKIVPQINPPT